MTDTNAAEQTRQQILDAKSRGTGATIATFVKLSGPGWLQGAITLGGGSLGGALYLGVIMGYGMMWLQPIAMILGVIMLSAISYVTLTTGEKPFGLLNKHISPVLGWSWLIATMMANIVWCLPQFALGTAAVQQNLAPGLNNDTGKIAIAITLLVVASIVVWFYNSGSKGIKLFELILKTMVGVVVLSFFGVVIALTMKGGLTWSEIFDGLIPRLSYLFNPVPSMEEAISASTAPDWWRKEIAAVQKDKIIAAFATAVGINMTFLLPYSMLRKGWGKDHRGLAIFDLSIGLIVPFVLATGGVVIAAASQFHAQHEDVYAMLEVGKGKEVDEYNKLLEKRTSASDFPEVGEGDRRLAAMLAARDNLALGKTLEPLVGSFVSQKLFGIGVLGMALSTIIILMLINGFAFCELIGAESEGALHRIGCLIPAVGVLGPFFWKEAAPKLVTPTSVVGGAMLPIAYLSFLLLMNSRKALGDNMPKGGKRLVWNLLMSGATLVAMFASAWGLWGKNLGAFPIGKVALGVLGLLLLIGVGSFVSKNSKPEN